MKKITLFVGMLLSATIGFSQVNFQNPVLDMSENLNAESSQRSSRVSQYTDTVWYNGFETPSDWMMTNSTASEGWVISSAATTNVGTWYFASGRINSTTGGNYAVIAPSSPSSPTFNDAVLSPVSAIDISAFTGNLVLHYEKYGARFIDTLRVEVSGDNMNWTELDNNSDFPINSTNSSYILANPTSSDLYIPSTVVSSDSLYIRFNWDANTSQPGIGYGFFIDDIMVLDVLNNDLAIDQTAFFDDARILYSWYFGNMPERQAAADTLSFSSTFYNRGKNAATNAQLELVVSGQDNATLNSASVANTPAGDLGDTVRTSNYVMMNGMGTYTYTWNIVSDSVDDAPLNNTKSIDLVVTGNEYSMAPLPVSGAGALGKAGTGTSEYTLSQDYYFMTTDTIYGIGVAFDSEWSAEGVSFQVSIIDDQDAVVVASDFYTSISDMITDEVIYFPVDETELVAGVYQVRFENFTTDSLFVVSCVDPASPIEPAASGGFFSRTTLSYGGSNFIEDMAYITIKTNDNITCNANASVTGTVDDSGEEGSITLTGVNGIEGPMYTYSWTGPNSYVSNSADLSFLTTQGTYSVTVTDVNRCTATEDFVVAGKVTVNEVSLDNNVSLFPNPNNGEFTLALNGVDGVVTIAVKNVLGQLVSTEKVQVNGTANKTMNNTNLEKGIYFVEVSDENNAKTVIRFIVE